MGEPKVWWLLAAGAMLLALATYVTGWNGWTAVCGVLTLGLTVGALVATFPTAAGLPPRTPQAQLLPPHLPAPVLGNSSAKGGLANPGVERLFVPPPLPKS